MVKKFLASNGFHSFLLAALSFVCSYPFTQENFTWVSFVVAFLMFAGNYYTTNFGVDKTLKEVAGAEIAINQAKVVESGKPTNSN